MTDTQAQEILRSEYAAIQDGLALLDQRLDKVQNGLQRRHSDLRVALQKDTELTLDSISTGVDLSLANFRIQDLLHLNSKLETENLQLAASATFSHERRAALKSRADARATENARLLRSRAILRETLRLVTEEMDDALVQVSALKFRIGKSERDYVYGVNRLRRRVRERDAVVEGLRVQLEEYEWMMEEMKKENANLREGLRRERKKVESARGSEMVKSVKAGSRELWRAYWV
ncbi:hypothetical protein PMIN02_000180 [Paraphaeosphaeria minitans]